MQIVNVCSVPKVTCESVCFSRIILDHPMKGVSRKSRKRVGLEGKRKRSEVKSSVEYVICPESFQKKVTRVNTREERNMAKVILLNIATPNVLTERYPKPNRIVTVTK